MKYAIFALLTLAWSGCSLFESSDVFERTGTDSVTFEADQDAYSLGSTAAAILRNGSSRPIVYNLCFTTLERKVEGEWVFVGPSIACSAVGMTLSPGDQAPYRIDLGGKLLPDLPEGTYRLKTTAGPVDEDGENLLLTTQPFSVRAAAER